MKRFAVAALAGITFAACEQSPTQPLRPTGALEAVAGAAGSTGITVIDRYGSIGGLNNLGHISGFTRPNPRKAFFWADGELTLLPEDHGFTQSIAWSINDADQVVGTLGGEDQAFVWDSETGFTLLGPGSAEAINNAPMPALAGFAEGIPAIWQFDGAAWPRTLLSVGAGSEWGGAFDLNDEGAAAGAEWVGSGYAAILWSPDGAGWVRQELGTLPGYTQGLANGINNAGQVSGWVGSTRGFERGFLWENGTMYELPPLPGDRYSFAYMLNDFGDVAGGSDSDAVIWRNRVPVALPRPDGAIICRAVRISEAGQAGGECNNATGPNTFFPVIWDLAAIAASGTADQLYEFIQSGDISNAGVANGLESKLTAAQSALADGDTTTASNNFGAFVNQVDAQEGKHITESAARVLSSSASIARDYLAP